MNNKVKIYFGAPLFSEQEQVYNNFLVDEIREKLGNKVEVYLPQENEALNDKSGYADSLMIYNGDNEMLDEADVLIALLDGQTMDVGLATEIGRFAHIAEKSYKPRYILGLYTDVRQGTHGNQQKIDALDDVGENQFHYANLYTLGAIKSNGFIYSESLDMVNDLVKLVNEIHEERKEEKEELEFQLRELLEGTELFKKQKYNKLEDWEF